MTRQELHGLVTDILAIHACPCCLGSMSERADTIMRAHDMAAAALTVADVQAAVQASGEKPC